jgi:hypothetical protein
VIQSKILSFIYMDILMTDKWFVKIFYSETENDKKASYAGSSRLLFGTVEVAKTQDRALNSYFD